MKYAVYHDDGIKIERMYVTFNKAEAEHYIKEAKEFDGGKIGEYIIEEE